METKGNETGGEPTLESQTKTKQNSRMRAKYRYFRPPKTKSFYSPRMHTEKMLKAQKKSKVKGKN